MRECACMILPNSESLDRFSKNREEEEEEENEQHLGSPFVLVT